MIYDRYRNQPHFKEVNNLPSMVENCFNPTIAQMLADPNCMLQPRKGYYDKGETIVETEDNWNNDIQNVYELNPKKVHTSSELPISAEGSSESREADEDAACKDEENEQDRRDPAGD